MKAALKLLLARPQELRIALGPPVTREAIAAFEAVFQLSLPTDMRTFYEFCNGFEATDWLFRLLSWEEIMREFQLYQMGVPGWQFTLAYLIYSDTWEGVLTPAVASGYVITNADHGRVAPVVLTASLAKFRVRYLGGSRVLGARGLVRVASRAGGRPARHLSSCACARRCPVSAAAAA